MVFRSWLRGTSVYGAPSGDRITAGRSGAGAAGAAVAAPAPAAGRGAVGAASRSRSTTRPSGPDPAIPLRSMPRSAAIRRASGDAFTRPAGTATGPVGAAGICDAAGARGGAGEL